MDASFHAYQLDACCTWFSSKPLLAGTRASAAAITAECWITSLNHDGSAGGLGLLWGNGDILGRSVVAMQCSTEYALNPGTLHTSIQVMKSGQHEHWTTSAGSSQATVNQHFISGTSFAQRTGSPMHLEMSAQSSCEYADLLALIYFKVFHLAFCTETSVQFCREGCWCMLLL